MSSDYYSCLMIGVAVSMEDVYRVLSHKPGTEKSETADVVLRGKVVKQIQVEVADESTEQTWTVREKVYDRFDDALAAFCGPLGLMFNYASHGGEIEHVWFSPRVKQKYGTVSFRQLAGVIKDMPRVRRIIKRVFNLGKLEDGVASVLEVD